MTKNRWGIIVSTLSLAVGCGGVVGDVGGASDRDEASTRGTSSVKPASVGTDRFGIRKLYPDQSGGRVWVSRWDNGRARTLGSGKVDGDDATFHNRGSNTLVAIDGKGVAVVKPADTGKPSTQRHYIWDRSRKKKWGNIELTFYAMRVREYQVSSATGRAGFTVEARTDDGHSSNTSIQCRGYAYAATMRYYGKVSFGKELRHPTYSNQGGPAALKSFEIPKNQWIGFKLVVRDEGAGVRLQLFRDMTDGVTGGQWDRLLDHHDAGGWGAKPALCGRPWDYVIKGAHPVVLLRNDNSLMKYKWASIRTIQGDDDDPFTDASTSIFRSSINWMKTEGLSKGCNSPFFDWYCPTRTVSRAEFAAMFSRALALPGATKDYFVDDDGEWYEPALNKIAAAGITKGCNPPVNNLFCPSDPLTRAQMATFFKRALGFPSTSKDFFVDDDSSVHQSAINALAAAGVTKGCNPPVNDRFCPNDLLSRGQLSAFLHRTLTAN